jgi:uridine kinase
VELVPVDDFYRPLGFEGAEPEGLFDLPRLRREVVEPYLAAEPISYRPFDWESGSISQGARYVDLPSVLIIEGVFALSPLLGARHSFGVWVEASRKLRLSRGLERDGEQARQAWTETWMPREDDYVERRKPHEHADLVVNAERPSRAGTFWRYERLLNKPR